VVVVERASGRTLMSRDVSAATPRLRLSGDGKWVAFVGTTSGGNTPTVLSVDGDAADLPFGVGYGQIDSFSADGSSFAIESGAGIELWDLATATHETTWGLTGFGVSGATLSPDWSLAVGTVWPASMPSASDQRVLTIWRPKDGTTVAILGTSLDVGARPIFDPSAAIVAGNRRGMHTLSTDWNAWQVWSADTGAVLRVFASSSDPADPLLPFAGGARLLTRLGSAFALWCR
jgi:hypothetical protein